MAGTPGRKRREARDLLPLVRAVLFREWDPIGVNGHGLQDEYDSYAPTICRYLLDGADEHRLVAHLEQLQRVSMGLSSADKDRDRRVARMLLALLTTPRSA